ncbi:unnamed protein product [Diamesa tonsa]
MPKMKFVEGERVLCYHGPLIYEAKALKSTVSKEKQVKYFIHYAGWNKNWDEWVPENRVLKYNEVNCQLQKETMKTHATSTKNSKKAAKTTTKKIETSKDTPDSRSSTPSKDTVKETSTSSSRSRASSSKSISNTPVPSTTGKESKLEDAPLSDVPKKKRQRLDTSISNEGEDNTISKNEISIAIPKDLKLCLVDDWHAINSQHKLAELPAKMTVDQIVEDYIQYKQSKSTNKDQQGTTSCQDVSNGILEYFNVMLGSQLLYKVERPQYAEILSKHPDTKMSKIYGAFHLLRLFVKLGSVLAFTTLDKKSIRVLVNQLGDFLKYLENNSHLFNTSVFSHIQTSEYLRRTAQ